MRFITLVCLALLIAFLKFSTSGLNWFIKLLRCLSFQFYAGPLLSRVVVRSEWADGTWSVDKIVLWPDLKGGWTPTVNDVRAYARSASRSRSFICIILMLYKDKIYFLSWRRNHRVLLTEYFDVFKHIYDWKMYWKRLEKRDFNNRREVMTNVKLKGPRVTSIAFVWN